MLSLFLSVERERRLNSWERRSGRRGSPGRGGREAAWLKGKAWSGETSRVVLRFRDEVT